MNRTDKGVLTLIAALVVTAGVAKSQDGKAPRRFQPLTAELREIRQMEAAYSNALVEAAAIRGVKAVSWDTRAGQFVEALEQEAVAPVQTATQSKP